MLTDIFSSFDPATSTLYNSIPSPLFWSINMLILSTIMSSYWLPQSSISQMNNMFKEIMNSQTSRTTGNHLKGMSLILSSLFSLIILTNITGLMPYVFSSTSHLYLTMSLAIPLWLSLIISSINWNTTSFIAGILPAGAPDWLNPFLTLVESISIFLRPITLSFRLAANMSAGHIALALMGIYTASAIMTSQTTFFTLLAIQSFYMIFELGICLIQAYIFCLLLSLYSDDHTSLN